MLPGKFSYVTIHSQNDFCYWDCYAEWLKSIFTTIELTKLRCDPSSMPRDFLLSVSLFQCPLALSLSPPITIPAPIQCWLLRARFSSMKMNNLKNPSETPEASPHPLNSPRTLKISNHNTPHWNTNQTVIYGCEKIRFVSSTTLSTHFCVFLLSLVCKFNMFFSMSIFFTIATPQAKLFACWKVHLAS